MKFELIDQAYNIPDFDNQATELTYVLNQSVVLPDANKDTVAEYEQLMYYGFKLALHMLQTNRQLIRPTLYATMVQVKKEYKQLTKFRYQYKDVSAVSVATNRVGNLLTMQTTIAKATAYAEAQAMQVKKDKGICFQLANDIRQMLAQCKTDGIWAQLDDGEPFMAGTTQTEAAENIGVSVGSVNLVLKGKRESVKRYKLWYRT